MYEKKKRLLMLLIVFTTVLFMTGCETFENFKDAFFGNGEDPEATVRIGVFEPLSGAYEEYGKLEKAGIELAHKLYPKALGKDVELIYADNKSDIYVAESAIQDLIAKRPAIVLGSSRSVYTMIGAQYLEEAKIPALAITNTNPLVTSNRPYYFRVCFVDSFEGVAVAKYAVEEMHVSTAAILKPLNDDSATAVSKVFSDKMIQLTQNPNVIVSSQDYKAGASDYSTQLKKIKASKAEVVFLPSSVADAAEILKQAKELGVKATFLGTDRWETQELIDKAGKEATEGIAFSTTFDAESDITEMTDVFLDAYRKEYGENAVPPSAVALGFDAYMLAIDSINRAGTALDGDKIVASLSATHQFPGASGSITFDSKGDPIKSVVIKTVRGGEIVTKYTVEPVWVTLPTEPAE